VDDSAPEQMSIFDYEKEFAQNKKMQVMRDEKHRKMDQALDEIRKKFGEDAIQRGTLLK
jgi:DNA polymerase-4